MGNNDYGQLGFATTNNITKPQQIFPSGIKAVSAGGDHTVFIKDDGSLWGMGYNHFGELGDGSTNNTSEPVEIESSGVTTIAVGYDQTLFIKSDGSLWATGDNQSGQLGDGTYNNTSKPELIVGANYQLAIQLLGGGNVQLTFGGLAGANYALERSFSLAPPNWVPQSTNPASAGGPLVLTITPNAATNNFWRICARCLRNSAGEQEQGAQGWFAKFAKMGIFDL